MKLLAAFLIAVAGDMPPPAAPVAPPVESFALGQVLTHTLSVCLDKADALEIAAAAKVSHEAALERWGAKEGCQNVPVSGPTVGRVVHSAEVLRNGAKVTLRVVEILRGARVIGYFLTTSPVSAKLEITEPSRVVPGFKLERTT